MAFTRVLGPGIHTASNINSHNINSTGIITAVSFVGDGTGLTGVASTDNIVTGTAATFTGGVDINSDLDVDGHTNLDNVSIAGVTTFSGGLTGTTANFSGNVTVGGVLTYEDVKNVDSIGIITARTGIRLADDIKIQLGNDQDLEILHDPSNGIIRSINSGGNMHVESKNHIELNVAYNPSSGYKENALKAIANQGVSLFFNGLQKFQTTNTGAKVTGTLAGASEVGIQSGGVQIGAGITQLNFIGAGNTFAVNGTTVDISIAGGGGSGAGFSTSNAGLHTTSSIGVNTSALASTLTGVGNSFQGLYVSNGMMIMDNTLNGNHYIGTAFNGLMAGPVNINGTLSIDGNYVVV